MKTPIIVDLFKGIKSVVVNPSAYKRYFMPLGN